MKTHPINTAVSIADAKIICDVVETYYRDGYNTIIRTLLQIFSKDITPAHYICLGEVIGLKSATDKKRALNNNHLSLCHRQN